MNDQGFIQHNLQWAPGTEGKGFILRPGANFPHMQGAQPIVHTWPTQGMRPTHPQMKVRAVGQVPHGMIPDPTSYFHIQPDGGVYQFGSGRVLNDEDYGTLKEADPNLNPVGAQPKVETNGYGHANRLLEILGKWREIPTRWRERQSRWGG
jgi:hypothetical protein